MSFQPRLSSFSSEDPLPGCSFDPEPLYPSSCPVRISSLQLSDAGWYQCAVVLGRKTFVSQPGYVGLEGEPWAQRSWETKNPEGSEVLEDSRRALGPYNLGMSEILGGQAAGGVYKLLGAGLRKIICFGQGGRYLWGCQLSWGHTWLGQDIRGSDQGSEAQLNPLPNPPGTSLSA